MLAYKYLAFAVLFFSLIAGVAAVPGLPHQFYGTVTVNGSPASDGTTVVAQISGTQVASTTVSGGKYGYSPIFYVDDPNGNRNGKTIEFYISGVKAAEAKFENGASTELNFSVTVSTPEPPSTPSPPSTGGGGGGGGGLANMVAAVSGNCTNQEIEVTVENNFDKPIEEARVSILRDTTELATGKTDASGIYTFTLGTAGDYKLKVTKSGYYTKYLDISLKECTVLAPTETTPTTTAPSTPTEIPGEGAAGLPETPTGTPLEETVPAATAAATGFAGLGEMGMPALAVIVIIVVAAILLFAFMRMRKKGK